MVDFFCPHCKQNTLDSFAVGLAHGRVLKCDFCMNEFTVSIVAAEHGVQPTCRHCAAINSFEYDEERQGNICVRCGERG